MTTMMSSNPRDCYAILHPEYFIDTLLAGGFFPSHLVFTIETTKEFDFSTALVFVSEHFPPLSKERHEIIVRFQLFEGSAAFSLVDIVDVGFFTSHRRDAALRNPSIAQILRAYCIRVNENPVGEMPIWTNLLAAYDHLIRSHIAMTILKRWFGSVITVSGDFAEQVRLGFNHQQSAQPHLLEPLSESQPWGHVVAYNAGLRPFQERKKVLSLQDIKEIVGKIGEQTKQKLKSISAELGTTFNKEIDRADLSEMLLNDWLTVELGNEQSYFHVLDKTLSGTSQSSFLRSAVLYLSWRTMWLDEGYTGQMAGIKGVFYFVNPELRKAGNIQQDYLQAIAEALYTLVYIGGAVPFQQALQETRLGIAQETSSVSIKGGTEREAISADILEVKEGEEIISETSQSYLKQLGVYLEDYRKKLESKDPSKFKAKKFAATTGVKTSDLKKGNFSDEQFAKVCEHLGIEEDFVSNYFGKDSKNITAKNWLLNFGKLVGRTVNQLVLDGFGEETGEH